MTELDERTPPHDAAAEQGVLGCMLMTPDAIGAAEAARLTGPAFYLPKHEVVYDAIVRLYGKGQAVDAITVGAEIQRAGETNTVGGLPYLHTLVASVGSVGSAGWYAERVVDLATSRAVIERARDVMSRAYSGQIPGADLAAQGAEKLQVLAGARVEEVSDDEILQEILDVADGTRQDVAGIPYGWYDLDALTGGMKPGQLIIFGGRPGMGKSIAGANIAKAVAWEQERRAYIASMEMTRREVWTRLLADHASVSLNRLLRLGGNEPDDMDWRRLAKAQELVQCRRLIVEDQKSRPRMGLAELRSAIRQHKPDVVVVDYLQLLRTDPAESRQQAVSALARGLKLLAQLEEVPIVALSQLNREAPNRQDKRPTLTDLRESGSLEQEADVVVLAHRPDYYEEESARPGEGELIVAKNRGGPSGHIVTVAAQLHYARLADMALDNVRQLHR